MKPRDSVRSCAERVAKAAWALETSLLPYPQRLYGAAESIGVLDPRDFPSDIRVWFARIYEAITAEGSFARSIRYMTAERAEEIAQDIAGLAAEVAKREEKELE